MRAVVGNAGCSNMPLSLEILASFAVLISMKTFVIAWILLGPRACHEVTDRTESTSCLSSRHSPDGTWRATVTGFCSGRTDYPSQKHPCRCMHHGNTRARTVAESDIRANERRAVCRGDVHGHFFEGRTECVESGRPLYGSTAVSLKRRIPRRRLEYLLYNGRRRLS